MKILAAIDQSVYAEKALGRAIELAKREGAELTIATVVEPPSAYAADLGGHSEIFKLLNEEAERLLDKAQGQAQGQGLTAKSTILEGTSPANRIVQYAQEQGIDLVVMGHKGRSAIERFLVGSVASKVVTYAPCSVLVVR